MQTKQPYLSEHTQSILRLPPDSERGLSKLSEDIKYVWDKRKAKLPEERHAFGFIETTVMAITALFLGVSAYVGYMLVFDYQLLLDKLLGIIVVLAICMIFLAVLGKR